MNPFHEPKTKYGLPKTLSQVKNNIAYVLTFAPDRFPKEDYLKPDEQPDLENEFWRLFDSLDLVCSKRKFKDIRPTLEKLLTNSFLAYNNGHRKKGMGFLHEFEDLIFGPPE